MARARTGSAKSAQRSDAGEGGQARFAVEEERIAALVKRAAG